MSLAKHGYPRPVILKNGEEVWLRPLDPLVDEARLFGFLGRFSEEDRWYLENDVSDPEIVRNYLLGFHPSRMIPIVAIDDLERIVGKASLNRFHAPGARGHIGRIRVLVDPEYRGQRLGTFMLLDMIQLSVNLGLRMLITEFIKGIEDKAIRAARKLDFFEQAVLPDYAKDRRGNNYDLAIMVKRLHGDFEDF
ncbi:MAG: GNAT family N-acetyltransferase [Desulfarculus sp.]|nr:GNAT family N-acetyltransferase [Desulfarculus sp.]